MNPSVHTVELDELRAQTFCGHISTTSSDGPDPTKYNTWTELLQATYQSLYGAAALVISASDRIEMETTLLRRIQADSFPEELKALKQGNPVQSGSRPSALSPEYDQVASSDYAKQKSCWKTAFTLLSSALIIQSHSF